MNQLTRPVQEIIIASPIPARPVRFYFPEDGGFPITVSRREVAANAEALCRVVTGERRQGIIDLAIALGIQVRE